MMMLDRISLESLPRCWGSDLTRSLVKFSWWWGFWLQRVNDDGGENEVVVMMTMTTEGWNTPKYSLNRWLLLKVHHWATILGFLTTIRFLHMMTMTMVLSGWELGLPNSVRGLPQMTIFLSQNFPHWPFHIFSHFHLNNSRVSFFTKYFLHDLRFGFLSQNFPHWPIHFPPNNSTVSFFYKCFFYFSWLYFDFGCPGSWVLFCLKADMEMFSCEGGGSLHPVNRTQLCWTQTHRDTETQTHKETIIQNTFSRLCLDFLVSKAVSPLTRLDSTSDTLCQSSSWSQANFDFSTFFIFEEKHCNTIVSDRRKTWTWNFMLIYSHNYHKNNGLPTLISIAGLTNTKS